MEIIEYKFERMPDSAQFCTNDAIHVFDEEGFIEFKAYCMINSMAEPLNIEFEKIHENEYKCHVMTACEMIALSERCIIVSGKISCRQVNHQLIITVREKMMRNKPSTNPA